MLFIWILLWILVESISLDGCRFQTVDEVVLRYLLLATEMADPPPPSYDNDLLARLNALKTSGITLEPMR